MRLGRILLGSAGLRMAGMFLGLLVGVQLARGLGAAGYGVYGIVMAVIGILMIPTELGLPLLVTREVAAARARDGVGATAAILRWAMGWVGLTSLVIVVGVAIAAASGLLPIGDEVRPALLIGVLWIPVVAFGNVLGAALRGSGLVIQGQLSEILVRPAVVSLLLLLMTLFWKDGLSASSAMAVNVLAAVIAAAISATMLLRSPHYSHGPLQGASLHIGSALPMGMSEGMRLLGGHMGMLVLGALVPSEQAGLYRVAYSVYVISTMPSALINSVCSPMFSRFNAQGAVDKTNRLNGLITAILVACAGGLLLLTYVFGADVLALVFGKEYRDASTVLCVFLLGELVASCFGHPTVVLNMLHRQDVVMRWSGIALVVNGVLTVALVHWFGYVGAAAGSVAGLVVWRAGCALHAMRHLGVYSSPLLRFQKGLQRESL